MKNIPRIFIKNDINVEDIVPISRDIVHYLTHVMRRRDCIVFGGGTEYMAVLSDDEKSIVVGNTTGRADVATNIVLYFAPIKRTDDLVNMATQMGVGRFVPVITARTVASHINWERMHKIAIEASEQSNRNSVPEFSSPINFADLDLHDMCFADERAAYDAGGGGCVRGNKILVGPEGGFSDDEFAALDAAGAIGVSLGQTILRAELAAAIAIDRMKTGANK